MIHKVGCVTAECDNCGEIFESSRGYSIFPEGSTIKDEMNEEGWYCEGTDSDYPNNHFCDKCFKYDGKVDDNIVVDLSRKK